jgi:hypothetical protein
MTTTSIGFVAELDPKSVIGWTGRRISGAVPDLRWAGTGDGECVCGAVILCRVGRVGAYVDVCTPRPWNPVGCELGDARVWIVIPAPDEQVWLATGCAINLALRERGQPPLDQMQLEHIAQAMTTVADEVDDEIAVVLLRGVRCCVVWLMSAHRLPHADRAGEWLKWHARRDRCRPPWAVELRLRGSGWAVGDSSGTAGSRW